jgi:hypothetical protein
MNIPCIAPTINQSNVFKWNNNAMKSSTMRLFPHCLYLSIWQPWPDLFYGDASDAFLGQRHPADGAGLGDEPL